MSISVITHPEIRISVQETSVPALNHVLGPADAGYCCGMGASWGSFGEKGSYCFSYRVSFTGFFFMLLQEKCSQDLCFTIFAEMVLTRNGGILSALGLVASVGS